MESNTHTLSHIRQLIRSGEFTRTTSGIMPDLVQGNVVILPKQDADKFVEFCHLNPKPCPILGVSKPGEYDIPTLGEALDMRHDIPQYQVFENGKLVAKPTNIEKFWNEDSVAIVLGCSFSFEDALQRQGFRIKNIDLNTNISMYETSIATNQTEHFKGNMVVTMRPFKQHEIEDVIEITRGFDKAHGAPVHIGDPAQIGINNLDDPDYGSAVELADDDIPVFWGCGVTTQSILRSAKLPRVITHAPGKMLITDHNYETLVGRL
ncbi:putative hydro-lyase [uncultured Cocleimonas sp.]|uniref:putative hydro-lyase n=1 Tax=uncultured Cocleimonas sp. TaxID=1051587 RepID=UPI00263623B3|nr:putative hydro-lyase [uncultured Cocleimonas sp.]